MEPSELAVAAEPEIVSAAYHLVNLMDHVAGGAEESVGMRLLAVAVLVVVTGFAAAILKSIHMAAVGQYVVAA